MLVLRGHGSGLGVVIDEPLHLAPIGLIAEVPPEQAFKAIIASWRHLPIVAD